MTTPNWNDGTWPTETVEPTNTHHMVDDELFLGPSLFNLQSCESHVMEHALIDEPANAL